MSSQCISETVYQRNRVSAKTPFLVFCHYAPIFCGEKACSFGIAPICSTVFHRARWLAVYQHVNHSQKSFTMLIRSFSPDLSLIIQNKRSKTGERTWNSVPNGLEAEHGQEYVDSHRNFRSDFIFEFISCF